MNDIKAGKYTLEHPNKINIILGKNGCGKSTLLRTISQSFEKNVFVSVEYIAPERGGVLTHDPNTEHNMMSNRSEVKRNQLQNFRQRTVTKFTHLERLFLIELEADEALRTDFSYNFSIYLNQINELLDNVKLKRDIKGKFFKIHDKVSDAERQPDLISSGEAELIALAIECLVFEKQASSEGAHLLLLDEPDVHLHPDLQSRFSEFLLNMVGQSKKNIQVVIVTHSTAILGAINHSEFVSYAFMKTNDTKLKFRPVLEEYRKILPIFGAHPLSNVFNKTPIFLVEGDDEERIWQQAVRTSGGKLHLYPCSVDGLGNMVKFEAAVEEVVSSVYDHAQAYSLTDNDDGEGGAATHLEGIVKRFRLKCRTSENLLLTDEVLSFLAHTWDDLKKKIEDWLSRNMHHMHFPEMKAFQESRFDRKGAKLKEIRNDLISILQTNKSWEISIGQTIGRLVKNENSLGDVQQENSIASYLGDDLVQMLLNNRREA